MARRNKSLKPRSLFSSPVPKNVRKPKMKWRLLPIMWTALKRSAMLLGFMIIISMLISLYTVTKLTNTAKVVMPDEMVLLLDFKDGIRETHADASLTDPFAGDDLTLRHYIAAIEEAKNDDRVKGILARLRGGAFSPAHVQEIRKSMQSFKESGKFAYIYSTSYGDSVGGLGRYYLASVFDELWMQPLGVVSIPGMNFEMPFMRETLDKIGVTPNFFQRKEFKTAYENLTNQSMSAPNREMLNVLVDDFKKVIVSDISKDREIPENQFSLLVDKGLFTADEALTNGLIDHMDYADVLVKRIRKDVTGNEDDEDLIFQPLKKYAKFLLEEEKKKHQNDEKSNAKAKGKVKSNIALVYAVGAIMPGEPSATSPSVLLNDGIAASNVIAPAILAANDDESIDTILLRVDSPGGSPAASEAILRALQVAKDDGKTIIVSMGSTAASGGYWIAANADQIFASDTTITGSIGVVGGKFVFGDLFDKIGVNWQSVKWGENSEMWSMSETFDESAAERINNMLDNVYRNFLERVAKGRNMSVEDVDKIARGRVWSGKSAAEVGLVDQLGGLLDAVNYIAQLRGGKDFHDVNIQIFPKPKTTLEQFIALLSGEEVKIGSQPNVQSVLLETLQPLIKPAVIARDRQNFMVYDPVKIQ